MAVFFCLHKVFGPRIISDQHFVLKNLLGPERFWIKEFLSPNFLNPESKPFWDPYNSWILNELP